MQHDLDAMVADGVLAPETADAIRQWYRRRQLPQSPPFNRLMLIFAVLGSLLVITGILLIFAHNWDNLGTTLKTVLAFAPMVAGQLAVGYTLWRKKDMVAWREVSGGWLALSIGACIALVSQIYHLPGELDTFLLTWLVLGGGLIYLLSSSVVAVLFLLGATWYVVEAGYGYRSEAGAGWPYWVMVAFLLPWYINEVKQKPSGFFAGLLHFLLPLSLLFGLGMFAKRGSNGLIGVANCSMLCTFLLLGLWLAQKKLAGRWNGYYIVGLPGSLGLLMVATFTDFWKDFSQGSSYNNADAGAWPGIMAFIITLAAIVLLINKCRKLTPDKWYLPAFGFVVYVLFWLASWAYLPGLAAFGANVFVLTCGVWMLWRGQVTQSFLRLNTGLVVIGLLAVLRFFDTELSFVLRGIIFIGVGLGFVLANYQLIQKKKANG